MSDQLNPVVIGSLIGSAELVKLVFGPSFQYLGDNLKSFVQKRIENTSTIIGKTEKNLKNKKELNDSGIDPLLIKSLIDYGSFCEDDLVQEYLAGLLTTSRIGLNNDNRAYSYSKLLETLSVYQIRSHYIIYTIFHKLFLDMNINLGIMENRAKLQTFIPFSQFLPFVLFTNEEKLIANSIIDHSLYGLIRNSLIEVSLIKGSKEHIAQTAYGKPLVEDGIVIQPSMLGIELFLSINSIGKDIQVNYFTRSDLEFVDLIDCSKLDITKCFIYP